MGNTVEHLLINNSSFFGDNPISEDNGKSYYNPDNRSNWGFDHRGNDKFQGFWIINQHYDFIEEGFHIWCDLDDDNTVIMIRYNNLETLRISHTPINDIRELKVFKLIKEYLAKLDSMGKVSEKELKEAENIAIDTEQYILESMAEKYSYDEILYLYDQIDQLKNCLKALNRYPVSEEFRKKQEEKINKLIAEEEKKLEKAVADYYLV
jgi:hypothetical protein